jgi:hypothetical protein
LTLILNLVFVLAARSLAKAAVDKAVGPGQVIDEATRQQEEDRIVRNVTIGGIVGMIEGGIFIILGIIIHTFPVGATIIALVLYVADLAVVLVINPGAMVGFGLIIRIVIVVALVQAVMAAVAYQKEQNAARQLEPEPEYE